MKEFMSNLKFDSKGLIPAVVQDETTGEVLMVAYMNEESFLKTVETGETWFWSRSRQTLWHKGETSGNIQRVKELLLDCDGDTLVVKVEQIGGISCHTGKRSCFHRRLDWSGGQWQNIPEAGTKGPEEILTVLYELIRDRRENPVEGSYTNYLFSKGQDKILKKVGEEAAEVIIASKNCAADEIRYEVADLVYHLLVMLNYHGIGLEEIEAELCKRRK